MIFFSNNVFRFACDQLCVMRYFCTIPLNFEHSYLVATAPFTNRDLHSLLLFFNSYFIINFYIFYSSFNYRDPTAFYFPDVYFYFCYVFLYTFCYVLVYTFFYVFGQFFYYFFFVLALIQSIIFVGVDIVECELDLTNFLGSFYLYLYLLST